MKRIKKFLPFIFIGVVLAYFVFLLRPAFTGELAGTFKNSQLPQDEVRLKEFLASQDEFYRVLWMPTLPHYAYYSRQHRGISGSDFFHKSDQSALLREFKNSSSEKLLQEASVKYVVIPFDSEKQIYITDRKYDEKKYEKMISGISEVEWLKPTKHFGRVIVYEVKNAKDHFWSPSDTLKLSYTTENPVQYSLVVKNARKGNVIVFSETYDEKWKASVNGATITSEKYNNRFNSFKLHQDGNYTLDIYYEPQVWVDRGFIVSIVSLIFILGAFIIIKKR